MVCGLTLRESSPPRVREGTTDVKPLDVKLVGSHAGSSTGAQAAAVATPH